MSLDACGRGPLDERYYAAFRKGEPGECWPWLRSRLRGGRTLPYGKLKGGDGSTLLAHRVGWELKFGPIPVGKLVLHVCDFAPCQNPAHWYLGTHTKNGRDKAVRGRCRPVYGDRNTSAKLTNLEARIVRYARNVLRLELKPIASAFGVSIQTVSKIALGQSRVRES